MHEHLRAAEGAHRLARETNASFVGPEIGLDGEGAPGMPGAERIGRGAAPVVVDGHPHPLRQERTGDAEADSRRGSRDEGGAILQVGVEGRHGADCS